MAAPLLTIGDLIFCNHGGKVTIPAAANPNFKAASGAFITDGDLKTAAISGCPISVPCVKITAVIGTSPLIGMNGMYATAASKIITNSGTATASPSQTSIIG